LTRGRRWPKRPGSRTAVAFEAAIPSGCSRECPDRARHRLEVRTGGWIGYPSGYPDGIPLPAEYQRRVYSSVWAFNFRQGSVSDLGVRRQLNGQATDNGQSDIEPSDNEKIG